jgi:K+-sensing histidine kinase KdpD
MAAADLARNPLRGLQVQNQPVFLPVEIQIPHQIGQTLAQRLTDSVLVLAFPGGSGTASLVRQARRMASRSPVPLAVVEVSPSAGLWAVPAASACF